LAAADGTRLDSSTYHLLPLDLRDPQALSSALASIPSLSKRRPTLWLAECLLVYLPPEEADGLVRGLAGWNEGQAWVGGAVYEMFGFESVLCRPFGGHCFLRSQY
jgi:O-methyltransferase involved in polyketide biosynthesis